MVGTDGGAATAAGRAQRLAASRHQSPEGIDQQSL